MTLILSTCWYILKAKYESTIYQSWIESMLRNVNNYYLVIYTDENSLSMISEYASNTRIIIVIKPLEEFYNYKYKTYWIENHKINTQINEISTWELNMLWAEKIHFVDNTIKKGYFTDIVDDTNKIWYGWCDIGYFRNTSNDMSFDELCMWPNQAKLDELDVSKIHYACVGYHWKIGNIVERIKNKNELGLPVEPLPPDQVSIGGGFFLLTVENIEWWKTTFDETLVLYFENEYLVKDDQMIVADGLYSNTDRFCIHHEDNSKYDKWFMFQRILS